MNITIAPADYANPQHRDAIATLMNVYAMDEMGSGNALNPERLHNNFSGTRPAIVRISVLAHIEGRAVGLVNCSELFSTLTSKPLVNIHDVIVLPEYRDPGVSQAIAVSQDHP